jgi:hypothetical protein
LENSEFFSFTKYLVRFPHLLALITVHTTQKTPHDFMTNLNHSSMDDTSLARLARSEPEAFAELYRRHVVGTLSNWTD